MRHTSTEILSSLEPFSHFICWFAGYNTINPITTLGKFWELLTLLDMKRIFSHAKQVFFNNVHTPQNREPAWKKAHNVSC